MSIGIVVVAALASWIFGAAYYMVLAKAWMDASSFPPAQRAELESGEARKNPAPFILSFLAELVMAFVLAFLIRNLGWGGIGGALTVAGLCWLGFVLTTLATNNAYGMRKPALTLIDAIHWLGVLLVQALVLAALG
jgi:hypothetical protein